MVARNYRRQRSLAVVAAALIDLLNKEFFFFARLKNIAKPSNQLKIKGQGVRAARADFALVATATGAVLAGSV